MNLDRGRLEREATEPIACGMAGQIDQDVDLVGANRRRELDIGETQAGAPGRCVRLELCGEIVVEDTA